jgi:hypothetical protein
MTTPSSSRHPRASSSPRGSMELQKLEPGEIERAEQFPQRRAT